MESSYDFALGFNNSTKIDLYVPDASLVSIEVYVRSLVNFAEKPSD